MEKTSARITIAALVIVALSVALLPFARSQIQVAPAFNPMGVAASGATTMAWFHNPATGTVMACQASPGGGGGITGIQCVSSKLQ